MEEAFARCLAAHKELEDAETRRVAALAARRERIEVARDMMRLMARLIAFSYSGAVGKP